MWWCALTRPGVTRQPRALSVSAAGGSLPGPPTASTTPPGSDPAAGDLLARHRDEQLGVADQQVRLGYWLAGQLASYRDGASAGTITACSRTRLSRCESHVLLNVGFLPCRRVPDVTPTLDQSEASEVREPRRSGRDRQRPSPSGRSTLPRQLVKRYDQLLSGRQRAIVAPARGIRRPRGTRGRRRRGRESGVDRSSGEERSWPVRFRKKLCRESARHPRPRRHAGSGIGASCRRPTTPIGGDVARA